MKRQLFYNLVLIVCTLACIILQSCSNGLDSKASATIKVAIREAGNQLLLKQNDSTSLIHPIIEDGLNRYTLSFQNQLAFEPSMLVRSVDSSFAKANLPRNYRVEVVRCLDGEVAYSFEIHKEEERTLIPCAGRLLPKACYNIHIEFLKTQGVSSNNVWGYLLFSVLLIILASLYFSKRRKDQKSLKDDINSYAKIGSFMFYPEQNKLVKAATEISLSKKECELLEIFADNLNQVVKRDELIKKVWEDNGVIVGRSLDTYISKLRKKLKDDERIKITNVHGVGYKLEIS